MQHVKTTILIAACAAALTPLRGVAQDASLYAAADAWVAQNAERLSELNRSIWGEPEIGLMETHAAAALGSLLERAGFSVEHGVAGMPTAFVASAGRGEPVIAILAEYDALPGMSQASEPIREPRTGAPAGSAGDVGHACGHSVFGTGSAAAAAAAWHAAREAGLEGTIRLYGTPAEETVIGKVYMERAGLFDDVDVALHWHPASKTQASYASSKALISAKFSFQGLGAHASVSPEHGHSALDAVELMNTGANFLREHLRDDARIHYVITDGGGQPNVVPPRATVWYFVRADDHAYVEYIFERMREIARGAALMTRTEVGEQIDTDAFELLPNRPLAELLQRQLARVGPPRFDDAERAFARKTQEDLTDPPDQPLASEIEPLPGEPTRAGGSTDVGNVSWITPTGGVRVASYTLGAPGHSWQIVACTGMSIGEKGMGVAARSLAGAVLELMTHPEEIERAREDFEQRRAESKPPRSVLPAEQPPPQTIR
jgi:aminobenzoyl-glutamate utilization protein B